MFLASFCTEAAPIFKFIGQIVNIFKIIIPVILVVIGVIALGKAVIANDDKEIKTATNSLIKKLITGVCIFFIPTIVSAVFTLIDSFGDTKSDTDVCIQCITDPDNCGTTTGEKPTTEEKPADDDE